MKELMILGTFHMESNNDIRNTLGTEKLGQMLEEIDLLVEKLSEYKPTKIFVEIEKQNQQALNRTYEKYLANEVDSLNEVVRVAFPLAKKTGASVVAIDWMEQGAAIRGCSDVVDELDKYPGLKDEIEQYDMPTVDLNNGIIANYKMLNSQKVADDTKAYYINYARIGVNDYYGMGWLIWWYQRNMNIFANISDALEDGDRAILVIGAAHKGLLEEFCADSKSVSLVNPLTYL